MTEPTKIRRLAAARREPDAEIIAMLEGALERAKAGEIIDCVVILATSDDYDFDYKINSDCYATAGYMTKIRNEIIADDASD